MTFDLATEIDKADYALLNSVSLDEWAAYLLAGDAPMEDIMNMPSHGLGGDELTEHFFRLWNRGLIECEFDESRSVAVPDFDLARQQFERTQNWPPPRDRSLVYRLSSTGSRLWEYFASPDWNKFLSTDSASRPNECTLTSSNRSLVELSRKCPYHHPPPIEGTDVWTVLQPWDATYWKTLPVGHQLTFQFEGHHRRTLSQQDYAEVKSSCDEIDATRRSWCKSFEEVCKEHFSRGS
jgi:hypothetical protein